MTTVPATIPADPDTIAAKSLDDDGWVPYPLGDDVISGEPNTHANILRTVGVKTPTLAASFFSADPSIFKWDFPNDESFVLLEGHITITFDTGERFDQHPNDAISSPAGRAATCEVYEPSRKFTVVTSA
jgi:uncharacterized cupin superfamily protein